jgi:hypothetical protein
MTEWETPKPESAEQLGQHLLEFIGGTEFGTTEFQAVSDYVDLSLLRELRDENINRLAGNTENSAITESDTRICETKIALLELQIEQNKSRLPRYSRTFQKVEIGFADLNTVSGLEAEQKFMEFDERNRYVTEIYHLAFNSAEEIVSRKRDLS